MLRPPEDLPIVYARLSFAIPLFVAFSVSPRDGFAAAQLDSGKLAR
jgi:hypothetical protein